MSSALEASVIQQPPAPAKTLEQLNAETIFSGINEQIDNLFQNLNAPHAAQEFIEQKSLAFTNATKQFVTEGAHLIGLSASEWKVPDHKEVIPKATQQLYDIAKEINDKFHKIHTEAGAYVLDKKKDPNLEQFKKDIQTYTANYNTCVRHFQKIQQKITDAANALRKELDPLHEKSFTAAELTHISKVMKVSENNVTAKFERSKAENQARQEMVDKIDTLRRAITKNSTASLGNISSLVEGYKSNGYSMNLILGTARLYQYDSRYINTKFDQLKTLDLEPKKEELAASAAPLAPTKELTASAAPLAPASTPVATLTAAPKASNESKKDEYKDTESKSDEPFAEYATAPVQNKSDEPNDKTGTENN